MSALQAAWEALGRGDADGVLAALDGFVDPDPRGRARAAAWRAQALQKLGRIDEADRALGEAIRAAKEAGDTAGVTQLRALRAPLLASIAALETAKQQRAADRALLDRPDETLSVDERIRKATVLTEDGAVGEAAALLRGIVATDARSRVLVLLALARCEAPGPHILAAHRIADEESDMNLVTAVAHAARAAGVSLPGPAFG